MFKSKAGIPSSERSDRWGMKAVNFPTSLVIDSANLHVLLRLLYNAVLSPQAETRTKQGGWKQDMATPEGIRNKAGKAVSRCASQVYNAHILFHLRNAGKSLWTGSQ